MSRGFVLALIIKYNKVIIDKNIPGIHELTFHSIMKCDPDCLKELSSNIILSGGSTIYQGMIERLTKEVIYHKLA